MPTILKIRRLAYGAAICTSGLFSLAAAAQDNSRPVVLDKVVAVVNNDAILASDVRNELRLSVLEPETGAHAKASRRDALDELISRTLIQQQIRQEEAQAAEPTPAELQERIAEIRKNLPACVRMHCESEAGWAAFLQAHDLTQLQAEQYLKRRMEILSFIEERFRQGIRISQQEIEDYYQNTLLPQYTNGTRAPSLAAVSPRISEILLQQQVNVLFDAWLENLRKQGDVEVLDASYEVSSNPAAQPGVSP